MLKILRNFLPILALVAPVVANGADDWQDRLAEATKNMPSAQEMQDRRIVDSYINEIGSNYAGETDEQRSQNVLQFAVTRLNWLSACSLLYAKEQKLDDGWVAQYRMDLMRRHLGLFATALVETIDRSATADELVATMIQKTSETEGPQYDEWLSSPEGKKHQSYKRVSKACSNSLRTAARTMIVDTCSA